MENLRFNISAVERDTGLSKDVLRMWERRYGFPLPHRDANGERSYPLDQVERLRMIKRLMDLGHRPGKLIATPLEELSKLGSRRVSSARELSNLPQTGELAVLLALIKNRDIAGYQQAMQQHLIRKGLQGFVQDIVAPLSNQVGEAWEQGRLEVFEEHLFTELTKRLLRQAMSNLSAGKVAPRVLLTSMPDEQHVLGLLMAETFFALDGAECIPLGTEMPLLEIVRAAAVHSADIVALSFSSAFPQRRISDLLRQLRAAIPAEVEIWAGGSGMKRVAKTEGVLSLDGLDQIHDALLAWRNRSA